MAIMTRLEIKRLLQQKLIYFFSDYLFLRSLLILVCSLLRPCESWWMRMTEF